ncbi:MAG: NUDIX hydrolase [Ahrensia sp.]|nr:NUDIX hydrolase [Ahrensia sp.]
MQAKTAQWTVTLTPRTMAEKLKPTAVDFGDGPRPTRFPNSRPRDASSMVLYDSAGAQPKFLMGRRDNGHVFMPGFFVFPGGKLERADYTTPHPFQISEADLARLKTLRSSRNHAQALLSCALREASEETGVEPILCAEKLQAHFVARAITPPAQIRRYDTRFFAAPRLAFDAIKHTTDGELHDVGWYSYNEIPKDRLHYITETVLKLIVQRLTHPDGMAGSHKIPCFHIRYGKAVTSYL